LLGTKIDLRTDRTVLDELSLSGMCPITPQKRMEKAKDIKAVKYLECSALTGEGLRVIFDEAVSFVLQKKILSASLDTGSTPSKKSKSCITL
jgi:hypothetical protein